MIAAMRDWSFENIALSIALAGVWLNYELLRRSK